jgi:hypothetical protein
VGYEGPAQRRPAGSNGAIRWQGYDRFGPNARIPEPERRGGPRWTRPPTSALSRVVHSRCESGDPRAAWGYLCGLEQRSQTLGGSPPVCAKVLFTMTQRPSILARLKKLINDTLPQKPSSATEAIAASPTCIKEIVGHPIKPDLAL